MMLKPELSGIAIHFLVNDLKNPSQTAKDLRNLYAGA